MNNASPARIIRGRIVSFLDEPRLAGASAMKIIEDGAVLIDGGRIRVCRRSGGDPRARAVGAVVDDHSGKLVMPGFIDTHIHYPQTRVVRFLWRATAGMAAEIYIRRRAETARSRPRR